MTTPPSHFILGSYLVSCDLFLGDPGPDGEIIRSRFPKGMKPTVWGPRASAEWPATLEGQCVHDLVELIFRQGDRGYPHETCFIVRREDALSGAIVPKILLLL